MKDRVTSLYRLVWALSLWKKGGIIVLMVLVAWFAGTTLLSKKAATTQYQTATVERGTLISSISASGTVSNANTVTIATSTTGVITAVYAKNGDVVSQGQKLADISLDQDAQQKQTAAYATYLSAQNNLNAAKAKMNSLQSALFKANQAFMTDKGANNPSDADKADPKYIQENADWLQAEADYTNQSGVIAQAEANYTSASLSYQQLSNSIYAPIAGTLTNFTLSAGVPLTSSSTSTTSTTSSSQSVGSVALAGGQLQAKVDLSEIDVVKAEVGQKVTMTLDAFTDKTFTGKVSSIDTSGSVSSGVTTYPAVITFDASEAHMYPNMAVSAKIITNVKDDVLLIPTSAIQTTNGTSTVRVMKNGQLSSVPVTIGASSDTQTEIVSGVSEGDTIVTSAIPATSSGTSSNTTSPFGGTGLGGIRTGGAGGFGGATTGGTRISR